MREIWLVYGVIAPCWSSTAPLRSTPPLVCVRISVAISWFFRVSAGMSSSSVEVSPAAKTHTFQVLPEPVAVTWLYDVCRVVTADANAVSVTVSALQAFFDR